ncbi:MAG: hypothetical protein HZB51_16480 [Chloroflexi bacterium]|nr:hypothetical protein [Chloroflexota bacterium]
MQTRVKIDTPAENIARMTDKITLGMILDAQGAQLVGLNQRIRVLEKRVQQSEQLIASIGNK